ncbi:MAG: PAS domain S-box protein [Candidatus Cloacimonetes bacterium]|nr:PAS domain S-box protein [Candidatus Cloacimonadota bacterium]
MYTENQIQIFVLISFIFIGIFVLTTVFFIVRLKLKDILLKKSERKLKEYSEDLEKRVEERTAQLEKSKKSYKQLYELDKGVLENSPAGIIRLDNELKIRYENPEMRRILGVPSGEELRSIGMDIRELPSIKETGISSIFNDLLDGKKIATENPFNSIDGKETYITLKGVPIFEDDNFIGAVLLINDITERKQAEEKYINQLKNMINLGINMRMELKLKNLLQNICNMIVESLGWRQIILSLRDYDTGTSRPVTLSGYEEKTVKNILSKPPVPIEGLSQFLRDEFKISHSYYIDHTNWEKMKKYPADIVITPVKDLKPSGWNEKDVLLVPIQGKKDILGFMSPDNPVNGARPTKEVVQSLEIFADQAAVAIENAELYEKLQSSDRRFKDIVANTGDWIWETDEKGHYTYSSPMVKKVLGYEYKEMLEKHFYDFFSPDQRNELKKSALDTFAKKGTFKNLINRNIHKDGHEVILETSGVPIITPDGKLLGYRGVDRDITEREYAKEALQKEKEYYHSFVTSLTDWVWEIDLNGVHTYSNPAVESILGYKVDEVVGHHLTELWLDDAKTPKTLKWLKNTLASGKGWKNYTGKFKHKKGSTILMESTAIPIFDSEHKLIGYRGIDHDITERKRAEEALKDSEEKFRDLFENANDVIWTSDIKGRYLTVNHLFETLLGYSTKELINKQSLYLIAQEDRKKSIENYQKVISGESVEYEASSFTKKGERKIFWLKLRPLKEKGKVVGMHGIGRDITELKKAEEELRETEKAEREILKELTLKLAHEIKNPLSSIYSSGQLAETTMDSAKIERHMKVIKRNVITCQKVINDLYNFVQKPELKLVDTDITKLLNEIESYVEALSDKIQLELNIDKKIPMINIDKIRIYQVLQNIVNNSLDAMTGEGTLTINAKYLIDSNEVLIEFIDTGCGISKENLDRVFHPFYSSKAEGFGLGLSLVKDIIEAHKGNISVESKEGKGTKFNVRLKIKN